MITKYKLFENSNIRYISDGEYTCPVCDSSELDIFEYEDYDEIKCKLCDFIYQPYYETVFNGSELYSSYSPKEISDDDRNIEEGFVSTGEKTCPLCNTKNIIFDGSDTTGDEDYNDVHCNKCRDDDGLATNWRLYYIKEFKYSEDVDGEKINIGDTVDVELINIKKYKEIKSNKFNL